MSTKPKVYSESQPDREAVIDREVCGVLLGAAVAGVIWMRSGGFGTLASVFLFAGSVVVCAFGAIRHGDSFWLALLRLRR